MDKKEFDDVINFSKKLKESIKVNLQEQRKCELEELKSNNFSLDEMNESIMEIESNYNEQILKLSKIDDLISANDIASLQQIKNVYLIVASSDVKSDRKDASIATLIALCARKNLNTSGLTIQEAYLFCNAMISVPLKNYGIYDKVMGTPTILDIALNKTIILFEQLDILEKVLDYCDEFGYDGMDNKKYNQAVSDCCKIISKYDIKNTHDEINGKQI